MKLKPIKQTGVCVFLSVQLLAATPVQATPIAFLDVGNLADIFTLTFPFLQGLATDFLQGLNIGGIDMSKFIMDVVFSSDGLLNGGKFNLGGLLGAAGEALDPVLSKLPGGQQIYSILTGLLNGSINPQSLLNGGLLQSILAAILGSSSNNENDPSSTTRSNPIPDATIGNGGVLGTGSVTCLYASTCRPNSNPYQTIFTQASGVQGYPNPNEVRGKIYEAATSQKLLSDIYAPNPNIGSYYAGNQSDRDINRATTEAYLSKAGQAYQKKISDRAQETVKGVADLAKNCIKNAKSSQELIRCNLLVASVNPSFDAAQLSVLMKMQQDDQFQKLQLGNISASVDAQRRQRDIENAGLSISSMKAIWTTPTRW